MTAVTRGDLGVAWDAVGDPLVIVDANREIVVFNRAAATVFGYDSSEVIGQPLAVLLPERFRKVHDRQLDEFSGHGLGVVRPASDRVTVTGLRKDGAEFPAEVTLAVLDVEGATMSAATIRDVSARVTTEQALAMSERRFRVAFEESPVAMALVDRDGHLIAGNAALSDLTGYSLSTLGAMTMSDLVEPADLPALVEQMQPLLLGDVDTARCQVRQVVADGSRLIIDLNLAAIRNDSGDVEYMLGQAIDITERVEAQRILEDLVRSKDELIASISHQLRTPLTALVGFANLMSNETADLSAGERSEMMASIMVEAASLTNLVDDLMVAAKSETGDLAVVHVPVDLGDQASRAIDTFGEADRSRIGIDGPTVVAIGDPARVRQVIRSLLGNAIHYGGERITIRIGSDEGHGYLAVADDGPEIPEPARTTMFEPYQRAHESVGLAPSLGLGLSVSRQLARLMGGDVTHRRQGSENVFELRLPDGGATREQSA